MAKKDSIFLNTLNIFWNGLKLYFLNFETFFKYLAFPIFGQIIGATLIFFASYIFTIHVSDLTTKSQIFDNIPIVFLTLIILTLPGFFIFCKAFWEFIIAYASLNSMASSILEGSKLEDTGIHTELIKRRTGSYILFLLLISLIYLVLSFPILWGLLAIVFVYLALSFQVFALEENKSAFKAIKTAINLIKYNFRRTALLLILLGIFSYWIIPGLVSWGFETSNLCGIFSYPVDKYVQLLPINIVNDILAQYNIPFVLKSYEIAKHIVLLTVSFMIIAFALPFRCICCTALYKELIKKNYAGKIAAEKLVDRAQKTNKKKNIEDK